MKNTLIAILLFVSVAVNAQIIRIENRDTISVTGSIIPIWPGVYYQTIPVPTENLTFYWGGSIRASDSTLINEVTGLSDTNYKVIDFQGLTTSGYISAKSTAKLKVYDDTIPITCLFSNYNYADTLYFKMSNHTVASDSTEVLPYRLEEIAYYSTSKTGSDSVSLDAYFNVPKKGTTNIREVGDGKTYATIQAAINAAVDGDTIYIYDYDVDQSTTSITINKELIIECVGNSKITTSATNGALITDNNVKINRLQYIASSANPYYIGVLQTGLEFNHCYINKTTSSSSVFNVNTAGTELTLTENVIIGSDYIVYAKSGVDIIGNYTSSNTLFRMNQDNITLSVKYNIVNSATITFYRSIATYTFNKVESFNNEYLATNYWLSAGDLDTLISEYDQFITATSLLSLSDASLTHGYLKMDGSTITSTSASTMLVSLNKDTYINNSIFYQDGTGSIITIDTDDSFDVVAYLNNSEFHTRGNGGGIIIGDQAFVRQDRINGWMRGCKVLGGQFYDASSPTTHGISLWSNNNFDFLFNYVDGWLLPFVLKGANALYNEVDALGNIWLNGRFVIKGVDSVLVANNIGIITDDIASVVISSTEEEGGNPSNGNKVYNNIFANFNSNQTSTQALIGIEDASETYDFDFNLLYNPNGIVATVVTVDKTFSQWVADGNDSNSYNSNPNLYSVSNEQFWPILPTDADGNGYDLGAGYDTLLLPASVWPNSIVTDTQDASWDIGAYKIE